MDNPNAPAPKKGLSGLAIAGIGCGGLIIIVAILAFVLLGKTCSKLGEVAGDFQKNPAKSAAILAMKMNPDVKIVSTDDAKNEITIKTKSDGKTMTMSFDDVANGKFTMTDGDGKKVTIDGSNSATGGGIVMKGPDGETVIGGSATASVLPAEVPAYPGLKAGAGGVRTEKGDKLMVSSMGETADAVGKVKEFYEAKLKASGFKVDASIVNAGGADNATINATKDDGKTKVMMMIAGDAGKTSVIINYEGPK
jgi:hypothetical protein